MYFLNFPMLDQWLFGVIAGVIFPRDTQMPHPAVLSQKCPPKMSLPYVFPTESLPQPTCSKSDVEGVAMGGRRLLFKRMGGKMVRGSLPD